MDRRQQGYMYALLAVLFVTVWPIFSKLGFSYYNFQTTAVLWFGFAAIFSFFLVLFNGRMKEYLTLKKHWKFLLLQGFFNTLQIYTGWYALSLIFASLHTFLSKLSIITMLLFGILFLKERYNMYEGASALLIISGALLISFSGAEFILKGVLLVVLWAIIYAITMMIIKKNLKSISPLMMAHCRVTMIAVFTFIILVIVGSFKVFVSPGLLFATLPSMLSAVFAHIFIFKAYKLIEMSKVELMLAIQPVVTSSIAYLVFGEVLTVLQIIGAGLIIVGAISLVYAKKLIGSQSLPGRS